MIFLRTEDDVIARLWISSTSEGARSVIVSITIRIRAGRFEYCWIVDRPVLTLACRWNIVSTAATILICVEMRTRAFTRNSPGIFFYRKFSWTTGIYISMTTGSTAIVFFIFATCIPWLCKSTGWYHFYWKIIAIYQLKKKANIIQFIACLVCWEFDLKLREYFLSFISTNMRILNI